MRIIAGTHRGRKILAPQTDATRPITDRVKQSLFDILAPRLDGAVVYDLFAGTGSMGLECLSRSASRASFFETDRSALKLLRENISSLGWGDRSQIVATDLFVWFEKSQPEQARPADLIFLDPPYRFLTERPANLQSLVSRLSRLLSADGLVIFRHDSSHELPLAHLAPIDRREYGSMTIELLGRADASPESHASGK